MVRHFLRVIRRAGRHLSKARDSAGQWSGQWLEAVRLLRNHADADALSTLIGDDRRCRVSVNSAGDLAIRVTLHVTRPEAPLFTCAAVLLVDHDWGCIYHAPSGTTDGSVFKSILQQLKAKVEKGRGSITAIYVHTNKSDRRYEESVGEFKDIYKLRDGGIVHVTNWSLPFIGMNSAFRVGA
ncbi:hypothetical protein [Streptomyces sp. 900105245]